MKKEKIKNAIKAGATIIILAIIIIMVITIMMRYEEKGEQNMPFIISKIAIVSTAEGTEESTNQESNSNDWKFNVIQNNDIYFTISKNENYKKNEIIKSVKIRNIQILENPKIGKVVAYMPNSLEGRRFKYVDEYKIENALRYKGASQSNEKNLEIGNQGGSISMSLCNTELGIYESNSETEVKHDGSLIKKMGIANEDMKFKVSFDFVIELENKSYKTTIVLDLPYGNITEDGTASHVITNLDQFIFKREN